MRHSDKNQKHELWKGRNGMQLKTPARLLSVLMALCLPEQMLALCDFYSVSQCCSRSWADTFYSALRE
jgi:hypothetical protein